MAQQTSDYPLNYGKKSGQSTTDRVRDMADNAAAKVKDAGAGAQEMVENIASQAREYGEAAQQAASKVAPYVETSVKERPMTTLLAAAAIGFVLGAVWKS